MQSQRSKLSVKVLCAVDDGQHLNDLSASPIDDAKAGDVDLTDVSRLDLR